MLMEGWSYREITEHLDIHDKDRVKEVDEEVPRVR